ncbi:MAG: hypothetical protein AAF915_14015 [Cyanobacteria bacterium P01_D01_bin.50]
MQLQPLPFVCFIQIMELPNTQALRSAISNVPYRVAVLASGAIAIGALALNYTDNRSTVGYTQVCFKPSEQVRNLKGKYCTASQRHWIADPILKQWERKQPEFYDKLTRLKTLPPENNNKHYYGLVAMGGALVMGGLAAARLNLINRLAPGYRQETHTQWHREAVKNNVQRASDAINGKYMVQSLQYQREIDLGRMQAGYLTPEEIEAQLVHQNYEQEYLQGQQQASLTQPEQQQLPGQSMEQVTNPSDKLPHEWTRNLIKQSALIWGNQGGGKSWLARYAAVLKLKSGYKVKVLDPDSNSSEWYGIPSYHSWEDIEQQVRDYVDEIETRLSTFNNSSMTNEQCQEKLFNDGKAIAFIVEEATTYGDFIKDKELLEKFGKLALTKSRKQLMPVTVVSHNNTQSCLFGITGLHNLVKKMLQVECLAAVDPITLKPKSTGKARIKLDSSLEWLEVQLPRLKQQISDFTKWNGSESNNTTETEGEDNLSPEDKNKLEIMRSLIQDCWEADSPKPENIQIQLSETAQKVLSIIQSSTKPTISLEAIRKSRRWGDKGISLPELKKAIQELITSAKVEGDESNGYSALS